MHKRRCGKGAAPPCSATSAQTLKKFPLLSFLEFSASDSPSFSQTTPSKSQRIRDDLIIFEKGDGNQSRRIAHPIALGSASRSMKSIILFLFFLYCVSVPYKCADRKFDDLHIRTFLTGDSSPAKRETTLGEAKDLCMRINKIGRYCILVIAAVLAIEGVYQIVTETLGKSSQGWMGAREVVPGQIMCGLAGIATAYWRYFQLDDLFPQEKKRLIKKFSDEKFYESTRNGGILFSTFMFGAYVSRGEITPYRFLLNGMAAGLVMNLFFGVLMAFVSGSFIFSRLVRRIKS